MGHLIPEGTPAPRPSDWAMLHSLLAEAWETRQDGRIPEPPVPLILAGAAFSTAAAIRERWRDLVKWANEHGFAELLAAHLPPTPDVDVADHIAGVSADGRGWWPEYGEQVHSPVQRPPRDTIVAALATLQTRWAEIVGSELSRNTRPLKFTGRKSRRLIVRANPDAKPPWGSWHFISTEPRSFTFFRQAINKAIAPLGVDDISFITDRWSTK